MALSELFTTDIGLLSLFTILFIIVMGVFIYVYAKKRMDEDEKAANSRR